MQMKKVVKWFCLVVLIVGLLVGCSQKKEEAVDLKNADWTEIEELARGTEVNIYMWGGSTAINKWMDTYVSETMKERYNLKVNRVPMNASEFINKLLTEKEAGKEKGSIDVIWINGENFRTARQADLLWGPFTHQIPNFRKYVDQNDPGIKYDFGYPVEGYEAPWGRAQMVLIYNSEKVPNPPRNFDELKEWVKANPGRFTYPALPDFTGSAFVRMALYHTTGGYEQYLSGFDQKLLDEKIGLLWDYLNEIEPYLWRQGKTYPQDLAQLDNLYAQGEVWMTMDYNPAKAANMIAQGVFPESSRSLVFDTGTIANTHFLAIPFNAPNKAGAMVLINFLESPEAQISKFKPENWGDMIALDVTKLPEKYQKQIESIRQSEATLSLKTLKEHSVPEIPSAYIPVIEEGWEANVLKK
ncbi:ABC transporter substrate-binding protein [Anoxybacter fermentans]|uniref:ABC transporter substrate-binding protein n=2 Tax=Anoxybacter fermentans TaxID=1323375 RepID=A0A3Q9HNL5_9FIRM|nr:ABC transporter substrate-binding protein [Anoxybacter fermentans]